jgi:hypothetical protein
MPALIAIGTLLVGFIVGALLIAVDHVFIGVVVGLSAVPLAFVAWIMAGDRQY